MTQKMMPAQSIEKFEIAVTVPFKVVSGWVWLTQENDHRDHFLSPGDELNLQPGRVVIEALHDSLYRIPHGTL